VLLDENQDLKRTLNVTDIPFYCIYDTKGKVVKRHTGYLPGDEDFMFEDILKYNNEK
jgi:thioredoxin-related protein